AKRRAAAPEPGPRAHATCGLQMITANRLAVTRGPGASLRYGRDDIPGETNLTLRQLDLAANLSILSQRSNRWPGMNLDLSLEERAFQDEVKSFLASALTPALRDAGSRTTSVFTDI